MEDNFQKDSLEILYKKILRPCTQIGVRPHNIETICTKDTQNTQNGEPTNYQKY